MQKEDYQWIRFYSKEDLGLYYQFESARPILDVFSLENNYDINQVLELFNVSQILETIDQPPNLGEDKFAYYKSFIKPINKLVALTFNKINQENFPSLLEAIVNPYTMDFLKLCGKYRVTERFDDETLRETLKTRQISLYDILQCEKWVEKFDVEIADFMMDAKESPEIIIKHFLEEKKDRDAVFYLPKSLSPSKKIELLSKYIDGGDFHPNYVELIKNGNTDDHLLPIDLKLKQKAEKAVRAYWNNYFENHSCAHYGAESSFDDIENEKEESEKGMIASFVFSRKWIKENLDYPTLWNNFIFLFDFVDSKLRCSFVTKEDMFLTSLLLGGIRGKKDYHIGFHFELKRMITNSQMAAYCQELQSNGIDIEDMFDWFFNTYIKQEFRIEGFLYNKPVSKSTMLEKCRALCIEMDGVLQQYSLYQTYGEIDRDLLTYDSDTKNISSFKSLQKIKYIYAKNGNFYREANLLIKKDLMYGSNFDLEENENFAELLLQTKTTLNDFDQNAQEDIKWLIERGSIQVVKHYLKLNISRYMVVRDIYENKNTTWEYWDESEQIVLQDLIDKKEVDEGNTLLSLQECDYFNFVMNRKLFSNGWNLRNGLLHGTRSFDNGALPTVYVELLKVFVLVVIKINEEFRIKFG